LELAGKIKGKLGPQGTTIAETSDAFGIHYQTAWQIISHLCKKKELVKERVLGRGWHFRYYLPKDYKKECCPTCGKELP
jgi:hypothetical protein